MQTFHGELTTFNYNESVIFDTYQWFCYFVLCTYVLYSLITLLCWEALVLMQNKPLHKYEYHTSIHHLM